ncbi:Zinc finger CCCH domain-containing protein 13, partial [Ophiophagus hannah]
MLKTRKKLFSSERAKELGVLRGKGASRGVLRGGRRVLEVGLSQGTIQGKMGPWLALLLSARSSLPCPVSPYCTCTTLCTCTTISDSHSGALEKRSKQSRRSVIFAAKSIEMPCIFFSAAGVQLHQKKHAAHQTCRLTPLTAAPLRSDLLGQRAQWGGPAGLVPRMWLQQCIGEAEQSGSSVIFAAKNLQPPRVFFGAAAGAQRQQWLRPCLPSLAVSCGRKLKSWPWDNERGGHGGGNGEIEGWGPLKGETGDRERGKEREGMRERERERKKKERGRKREKRKRKGKREKERKKKEEKGKERKREREREKRGGRERKKEKEGREGKKGKEREKERRQESKERKGRGRKKRDRQKEWGMEGRGRKKERERERERGNEKERKKREGGESEWDMEGGREREREREGGRVKEETRKKRKRKGKEKREKGRKRIDKERGDGRKGQKERKKKERKKKEREEEKVNEISSPTNCSSRTGGERSVMIPLDTSLDTSPDVSCFLVIVILALLWIDTMP